MREQGWSSGGSARGARSPPITNNIFHILIKRLGIKRTMKVDSKRRKWVCSLRKITDFLFMTWLPRDLLFCQSGAAVLHSNYSLLHPSRVNYPIRWNRIEWLQRLPPICQVPTVSILKVSFLWFIDWRFHEHPNCSVRTCAI